MTEASRGVGRVRVSSPRTRRTYAADWALFTDWCAATDVVPRPAEPGTVVAFLTGCPAARATQRCRIAAIDHQHTAGHGKPGESPAVRAALGRPSGAPFTSAAASVCTWPVPTTPRPG